MSLKLEGYSDAVAAGTNWTALSASTERRVVFVQPRNNVFVRVASDPANTMVLLGETSGSVVDLGVNAPVDFEFQAISGTATVSMFSLHPSERR